MTQEISRRFIGGLWRTSSRAEDGGGNGGSGSELLTASLAYSTAQILALNSTPREIVAAPGAGFVLVPLTLVWFYFAGDTPYEADHNISVDWNGDLSIGVVTANGGLFRADDRISYGMAQGEARKVLSVAEDQALVIHDNDSNPTDGNGTGLAVVYYMKTALS